MAKVNKAEIVMAIVKKHGDDEVNYRTAVAIYDFIILSIEKQLNPTKELTADSKVDKPRAYKD